MLRAALAGPLREVEDLVFCTRARYDDPHWYANIGYYCEDEQRKAYPGNGQPDVSRLYRWNIRTGQLTTLLDAQGGSIRDPQVHYDASRILFSYRKAGAECYHLYELGVDGTGLRQLTDGPFDDYEPTYLPDGDIVFVSTRCRRWVNCWKTQVGTLHRCDARGGQIRPVSANTEHDNTPWPLPDGRLLYMRWEYVDRSQVEYHGLWTMNPDGTGPSTYFGNLHSWTVMLDAKPVPGSADIVASFSPGHGVNEHAGIATVVSPKAGPDHRPSARPLHTGALTRDPYPFSDRCFIAARDRELVLLDGSGAVEVLYRHTGAGGLHEPRPIQTRPRERVLQPRTQPGAPSGRFLIGDIYRGRNLPGVKRGDIRRLLVLESLPKPVNFSGGPDLVSWLGTFTLERVLGTVPVETDGSAYFEAPADRQLFFVALDANDLSVKRMQSWCSVRPGEVAGCVGCHEPRTEAPGNLTRGRLAALGRPASRIAGFDGFPDVLDFTRDIQPILDRRCVACHSYTRREGRVILAGDLGPHWSHGYFSLFANRLVADGRNGLGNQPPRTIGSSASRLLRLIDGSHYDAKATAEEWRTLWLWIESGAPYAGTYAALRNEAQEAAASAAPARVYAETAEILGRRCYTCHKRPSEREDPMELPFHYEAERKTRSKLGRPTGAYERIVFENDPVARLSPNILLNLTRPELSPLVLAPLARSAGGFGTCGAVFTDRQDPDCERIVKSIRNAQAALDGVGRFATATFKPNRQYVRELQRYGILPAAFDRTHDPLDGFAADQAYWRSLWPSP
jgi:cytochrome c553